MSKPDTGINRREAQQIARCHIHNQRHPAEGNANTSLRKHIAAFELYIIDTTVSYDS